MLDLIILLLLTVNIGFAAYKLGGYWLSIFVLSVLGFTFTLWLQ